MASRIRPATPDDSRGIAEVHVGTWRAAYAGIVPKAHLDGLSVEARATVWRTRNFPTGPTQAIWVAEEDGSIVGFANAGTSRDEGCSGLGELRAIYVDPGRWDAGVGSALHDAAVSSLRAAGFPAATLWVLEANARARRFYERRGWRPDAASKTIELGGAALVEVRYRLELTATSAAAAGSKP